VSRARLPVAKAKATGAAVKNPGRHSGRKAIKAKDLGGPSAWLSLYGHRAFQAFRRELPWLKEHHRVIVDLASHLRGRLMDPEDIVGLPAMQELRRCLAVLAATPADESKVTLPDDDEGDPDDAFFDRPN
jgi:hypothetical protein